MALAILFVVACESAGSPDAGGMDAGARDGGRDAEVGPPSDGGRARACEGTAVACALLDEGRCRTVDGCRMSQCGGFPIECSAQRSQADCMSSEGCTWSGSSCSGRAARCASYDEPGACGAQPGCVWSPVRQCRGEATPCDVRSAEDCEGQPGCGVPRDSGSPVFDAGLPTCEPDAGRPPGCMEPAGPPSSTGCNATGGVECDGDWTGTNPTTGRAYCDPACASGECCSPRDGRFQCVEREADGACPGADIFVDASRIDGRYTIEERFFEPTDCAIVEGCVNGSGMRRLLRFDTYTPNVGGADLYLGAVPPTGTGTDVFEWSSCHGHHHFRSYAEYELLSADGCCVAVTGRKQAFCLIDLARYRTDVGSEEGVYNCGFQGIQRGWQDIYSSGLDCQWIDITGVPAGDYQLRIRLNTEHVLLESRYDNNEALVRVTIP